ncbi:response regulator [Porphyromonas cangingivalis]|nr:response regulator [Porphyromonas cangingivalis]
MRILVIDDADMSDSLNSLKRKLSRDKINLTSSVIHLNNRRYYNLDSKLDLSPIKEEVNQVKQQGRFDLIMVDYNYGEDCELNGLSIIQELRKIFHKTRIILYSGSRKDVIKYIIESSGILSEKDTIDYDEMVKHINNLMEMKIETFIQRNNFESEAIKVLKQNSCKDVKELLMDKLSLYPNLVVHDQGVRGIGGKSLKDVVEALGSDDQTQNWLDEILDEFIAYLTKIYE